MEKKRMKKHLQRGIAFLLAAAMIATSDMGVLQTAFAQEEVTAQTESPAAENQEPAKIMQEEAPPTETDESTVPDEATPPSEGESVRESIDWTQDRASLNLTVERAVYASMDAQGQNQNTVLKSADNKLDLTAVDPSNIQGLLLKLGFDFIKAAGERNLRNGDVFTYIIPTKHLTLHDTIAPETIAVTTMNRDLYRVDDPAASENNHAIGTYTIKNNVITVTLSSEEDLNSLEQLFGVITVPVSLKTETLSTEESVTDAVELQTGQIVEIHLPMLMQPEASVEEEGTPSASEITEDVAADKVIDKEAGSPDQNIATDESVKENTSKEASDDSVASAALAFVRKGFARFVQLFSNQPTEQKYAGGNSYSYTYTKDLPEAFSKVKVKVYNKEGGYQTGDDLRVGFNFGIWMDDDFLYSNFQTITERPDFPSQGSMSDEKYETDVLFPYLQDLSERGEIPEIVYDYNLCDDFNQYNITEPVDLYDASGEHCGHYIIQNGVVTFTFDSSSYYYGNIVASVFMEAALNKDAVSDDPIEETINKEGEIVHQSIGEIGGGSGSVGDSHYSVEKEGPARVENSEIIYTIKATATEDSAVAGDEVLNGKQIVDVLPEGLELKDVSLGGKPLSENEYTYDSDTRTLTYTFETLNAEKSNKIASGELKVTVKLNNEKYQQLIKDGSINETFTNKASIKENGKEDPLAVSDEIDTTMKFNFLKKDGSEVGLDGTRYKWTIEANTQLPYLDYGYIADILNWTDQTYDFATGITVYNDKGEPTTYKDIPYCEGTAGEWTALTAEKIKGYIDEKGITKPFYYLYDSATENPLYIEGGTEPKMKQYAVLIIPFKEFAGTTEPKSMKIQYFTDMNLHGKTMDEFSEYVREDKENRNPEIGNAVNLFWKNIEGGIGPGNRLPESVTWDKTVDTNVEALTKKAVAYNAQTQMLTWKMDVNRYGASLTDILIEDSLPNATYEIAENGDLTVHCYKYNMNTKEQEGDVVTLAKAKDASHLQDGEYALTPDGDNTKLSIKLPDLLVTGADGKVTAYYYVLDFALKVVDPTLLSTQSSDQTLGNHAKITAKLDGKEFEDVTDAECKIPNILIDKTAVGSYNYQTNKLSWNVTINPNKLPVKDAKITDTLPDGITWDRLTKITVNGVAVASDAFDDCVTVTENGNNTVTLKLKKEEINDTYSFQFDTNVTDTWRDKFIKDASDSAVVENTAALSGTVYEGTIDPKTVYDTAINVVDPVKVTKGGVYDEDTGTVTWTVLLNVDQVNLQNMHLVEDLYFGMGDNDPKIHALDADSIQVYQVTLDQYGAVKSETEVSTPDLRDYTGSGNSTPSERGFSFYAPTTTDDYTTYKITFKTDLLDAATENPDARILNQVYLKNADGSDNETSDSSDGGYEGGFDADDLVTKDKRPKIKLTKSSANSLAVTGDPSLLLDNAEFTITAYSFKTENDKIILEKEIQKYDKVRLTTDGTAVFLNIKATSGTDDLIYMLKETDSPAGYQSNDKQEFVLFTSPTNKGMYTGMTSVTADQKNYPLIIKDADPLKVNYHVINSSGTADDTLAGIVYQDVPVETEFFFTKEILTGVNYENAGGSGAEYTYASPEEGTVTFKLSPNDSKLNGKVKDRYITNDAAGKFTVKGLDAGTYKLTEVKSPENLSVGAEYALNVTWNKDTLQYVYEISGKDNENTYLEKDATTGAYTIKDNYVTGNFSFTKVVQYKDESADGTNPNNNRENLAGVTFTLTSSQIAGKANNTFKATVISGKDGKVAFTDIPVGVYTLAETVKQGYEQADPCTVTVKEVADTKTVLGTIEGKPVYGKKIQVTYSDENLVKDGRYNNTAIKGTITFTKKAYTDITGLTALSTTLSGAEFGLYRKIGNETASKPTYTATSGADGAVSFSKVEYGDYVLKEITTPTGYNKVTDIEISRSALTIENGNSKFSYTVNSADQGIVKNALIKADVTLTKKDQDGNLLANRVFHIYRRNSSAIGADGSGLTVSVDAATNSYYPYTPNASVTTGDQGTISVNNLPYGEYVLVEQKQNDQQEDDNTAIYVNVTAEDKVTILTTSAFAGRKSEDQSYYTAIGDTSTWTSVNNKGVIVDALKYGSVQIKKLLAEKDGAALDQTQTPISAVDFKVEKLDASGNYHDYLTLKTNATGTFTQEKNGTYKDAKDDTKSKHFLYGTYKFTEVKKSGLLVDDSKSVEVTFGEGSGEVKHGNIVYLEYDGTANQYETEIVAENQTPGKNAFYNTAARATISLKKQGEKDEPLNDAIFAVYLASDSKREKPIATLQDGSNGEYQLSDKNVTAGGGLYKVNREDGVPYLYMTKTAPNVYMLLEGDYVLKEVNAPVGYEVFTSEIPFTISQNTDGTVSASASDITDVTFKDGQFTVTDHPVELTIEKQDKKDSAKLAGAEFELSSVQNAVETNIKFAQDETGKYYPDSKGTETLTTAGMNGNLTITKLPIGSYKLLETKAADGYQKLNSTVAATFTVGADGKIEAFTSDSAQYFTAVAASTLITVKNQKNALEFTKLKSDAEGNGLNGAVFTLTPVSPTTGNPVSDTAKTVNGKEGIVRFEGIKAGTYTLQEISAPSGYAKSDAVFTVIVSRADGSITLKSGETVITKEKLEELFTNTKNSLTITKGFYNAGGTGKVTAPTTLPVFTLYRLEGNVETKWADATVKDGTAVFNGIPAGSYKLHETNTDSNFIQTTEVHDVVVSTDGKVTVDSNAPLAAGVVTIANYKKAEISFTKKDQTTKTGIAGIDFTLTGTEPEVAAATIDSATDGTVKFTGLNPGKYTLVEGVKASTLGYVKNPEVVYIVVGENGTVSYYKDAEYKETLSGSLDTFFVNQPNQLSVNKTYTKYHDTSAKAEKEIATFELVPTETGKANIVLTANTDGTLYTAERIPEGTYTLRETVTPTGYVAAADIKVVVGTDGKITVAQAAADITVTAAITNAIESTEVTVKKNWVNREAELRGAGQPEIQTEAKMTLKVQTKDADGKTILSDAYDCDGNKVESYTVKVSEGNTHTFTNLPKYKDGIEITYVVEETRVDGYTVSGLATEANGYTITNTENSLTINKSFIDQNKGGTESEWTTDPTFALTKADGAKISSVMDKNSKKAIFTQIPDGTYTLQEDSSDGAYITNATTYTVKVEGGVITFTDAGENTSGTNVEKSYTNYKSGHFDFTKYMTENGAKKALEGAAFQLTPADTTKKPIVRDSEKNGSVEYTDLQPGEYTLQETKTKAGYAIKTNLITVHVADDGLVTFSEIVDGQSVTRTKSELEAIFQNEPTNVIIKKLDKYRCRMGSDRSDYDGRNLHSGRDAESGWQQNSTVSDYIEIKCRWNIDYKRQRNGHRSRGDNRCECSNIKYL
ncbi:MAG: SpaA isopeptide-forming pilin-related protein [Hespellia sp.]|nr:SpaA isopeptide-forming pilin-related protein [Hespellia sp.]